VGRIKENATMGLVSERGPLQRALCPQKVDAVNKIPKLIPNKKVGVWKVKLKIPNNKKAINEEPQR
jgi:hypothetical protein